MIKAKETKKISFWENFIFLAIILVVIQTFLDDCAQYLQWSVQVRTILLFAGFACDFIFTIEFFVRTVRAHKQKGFLNYWLYQRGWVDFLSSVPLLFLSSGPSVCILFTGTMHGFSGEIGILNVFKIIKAIRVTRVLRLIRIVKIFGRIRNTESKMAQHHTSAITTTAIFSIIITLIVFSATFRNFFEITAKNRLQNYQQELKKIEYLQGKGHYPLRKLIHLFYKDDVYVVQLSYQDKKILSRIDDSFKKKYMYDDFRIVSQGKYKIYISLLDINSAHALFNLQYFAIITVLVFAFMLVYTRHFVQTVSDIVYILNLGLRKKDYMVRIKMRDEFKEHEIFELANFYNNVYLPAKLKKLQKEKDHKSSSLSMDELMKFKK